MDPSQQQQHNNHAFQAGFAKAKDEFDAGYKAAIGQHHPAAAGSQALGQDVGGDMQRQQQMSNPAAAAAQTGGFPGGQTQMYSNDPQSQAYQQQNPGAGAGAFDRDTTQMYANDPQSQAYQQHRQELNQDPGAGGALSSGTQMRANDPQTQAHQQHKQKLNQDPGAGGALGGVQQQAYDDHKAKLDRDPTAGGATAGPTAGGPGAGVTGGNFNTQLEEEAALHSGRPHGLGSKIKSRLPNHFNDGTKVPRDLREDASGQTGPGPL